MQFNRGYNLRRHEKEYCPLGAQERNMSQTDSDSQERDFQDDVSTTSTEVSEISTTTDNESETEPFSSPEPFSLGHSLKIRLWFTRPNGKI